MKKNYKLCVYNSNREGTSIKDLMVKGTAINFLIIFYQDNRD